jgi:hypothetical protein
LQLSAQWGSRVRYDGKSTESSFNSDGTEEYHRREYQDRGTVEGRLVRVEAFVAATNPSASSSESRRSNAFSLHDVERWKRALLRQGM